jgi:hypothetical protein
MIKNIEISLLELNKIKFKSYDKNDKNKCVIAIIIYYIHMYLYITFLYLHSIYNLCDIYVFLFFFALWCLTPLSTIFQLYRGG